MTTSGRRACAGSSSETRLVTIPKPMPTRMRSSGFLFIMTVRDRATPAGRDAACQEVYLAEGRSVCGRTPVLSPACGGARRPVDPVHFGGCRPGRASGVEHGDGCAGGVGRRVEPA